MADVTDGTAGYTPAGFNPAKAYSPDMDGVEHEHTYVKFTHFTTVGSVFVLDIVAALAIGAGKHAWITTVLGVIAAHIACAVGLASPRISWRPGAVILVLLLVLLALY